MLPLFCFASFSSSLCFLRCSRGLPFNRPSICRRPDSHTCFFFFLLFIWRCRFFRVFFVPLPLSPCMESTSYVISFRMVFFCLVTTGCIFYINSCENSINQNQISSTIHVDFGRICTEFRCHLSRWISEIRWCHLMMNVPSSSCMYVCMYVWSSHIAEYGSTG